MDEELKKEIRSYVDTITLKSIGNQDPKGFCFSTSFALYLYLRLKRIRTSIVGGTMDGCAHFWLKSDCYDDIIDATLKQFDKENCVLDLVYIGEKSKNKITEKYQQNTTSFNEWIEIYKGWCDPEKLPDGNPRENTRDVEKVIINNLIAASIVYYEIENAEEECKQIMKNSPLYNLYFNPIKKGLKRWKDNTNLTQKPKELIEKEFLFFLNTIKK